MKNIKLLYPRSLEEALSDLAEHGDEAKIIAGGTAVAIMLKNNMIDPSVLISMQYLDELRTFDESDGELRFGALKTIRFGETSPVVRAVNPVLAETFGKVASVRVRSVATIGGNMTEADYASDPPGVLIAMGASVDAIGPNGSRSIPLGGFFEDFYTTTLEHDEILTGIVVPAIAPTSAGTYIKFCSRSSEDRPCAGVTAIVDLAQDGTCRDLRVVVSAVSEIPVELSAAEDLARGQELTDGIIRDIARAYADEIDPLGDLRGSAWYRTQIIEVLVRRAIDESLRKSRATVGAS